MTLLSFLSAATLYDLGWTLLHFLWQGLLLAALLEVALPLLKGVRARHNAAFAVLVLMVCAPVATFLLLHGQGSVPEAGVTLALPAAGAIAPGLTGTMAAPAPWIDWLVLGWLAGMALLSLRALAGWRLAEDLRRRDTAALPAELLARCQDLAQRLAVSRAVRFLQSQRVDVPVVIGWFRPVILLPISAIAGLPPQQLDALVMHELAHIRRHDAFINVLLLAAETALFYHPAVWWVGRRIRIERENCCDDLAVAHCGDAVLYVEAMTTLAGRVLSGGMALAADGGSLKDRAARLLGVPSDGRRYSLPAMGVILVGLLAAGMAMAQPVMDQIVDKPPVVIHVTDTIRLERLTFTGNSRISQRDLAAEIGLAPGDVVDRSKASVAAIQLSELYRRNGKTFARIEVRTQGSELIFAISEGPSVGVQQIAFVGNNQFDAATLRGVIATRESAWYRIFATNDNYDPDRLDYDRELLRRFYAGRGFANFKVNGATALLTPSRRNFNITFYLDETGQGAAAVPVDYGKPVPIKRGEAPPLPAATGEAGANQPIAITADKVENGPDGTARFTGSVVVRQGDTTIRADRAQGDRAPSSNNWRRLVLDGHVLVITPQNITRFPHLEVTVTDQRLQFGQAASEPARAPWERRAQALPPGITDFKVVITGDKDKSSNITIHAGRVSATASGPATLYQGNAVLSQGDVTLRADTIRLELAPSTLPGSPGKLARLIADGNVELTRPGGTVRGAHLEIPVIDNGLQVERDLVQGSNVSLAQGAALTPPPLPPGPPPPPPPAETMNLARLLLPLPPAASQRAVDNTMNVARQIGEAARSCAALEAISQDPVLKGSVYMNLGNTLVANLPPELQKVLAQAKPGEAAMPVLLDAGVEIFARCD